MKKYILLIIVIFILTGCDATYNLIIDDNGKSETTFIRENDGAYDDGIDMYIEPYEKYTDIALPVSKKDGNELTMDGKKGSINYYDVSRLYNEFGLKFTGNFGKGYISNSNIVNAQIKKGEVMENAFSLKINISNLKAFENHPILDNLTINITVNDGKVEKNNADEVNGNTYTWNLDRDNYKDKSIELRIIKDFKSELASKVNNNIMIVIVGCSIFLLAVFLLIYYLVKQNRNVNRP